MDKLFEVLYGSHLYGTSTEKSDFDRKVVYLPEIDKLLLCRKPSITKTRVDAAGVKVPDAQSMPDGGTETEFFPLQTFVHDFVHGQTYALEMAYALLKEAEFDPVWASSVITEETSAKMYSYTLIQEMVKNFSNADVYSMVGFAMKQTFDYVKRGERLNEARKVLNAISKVRLEFSADMARKSGHHDVLIRLDSKIGETNALDIIVAETGLPVGESVNGPRVLRTLELNGRSYLETSALDTLVAAIQKLIDSYGQRTNDASKKDVDYKSLSHAVRVYEQAIELLDTGTLTFPRKNAAELLRIKQGLEPLSVVKSKLILLDAEVQRKIEASTMRKRTPELEEAADVWLLGKLRELYHLT